jgi:transposase
MNIQDYQALADSLLAKHGLTAKGWSIGLDDSKSRFGICRQLKKRISLSRHLITLNSIQAVTDTILHEIAHALAPARSYHNAEWQRIALSIGCNGERCYNNSVITPPKAYTGTCPNCKRVISRHRRARGLACGRCCKAYNNGLHSNAYRFIWRKA